MSLNPQIPTTKPSAGSDVIKQVYQRPELRTYGAVRQFTQGTKNVGYDANVGGKNAGSDRAIKCNVVQVGTHPSGIGLYLFDYRSEYQASSGYGRQFGVMADEVEAVLPEAVSVHPNGYKQVDYALLGIEHSIR